jgi:hypothetical protein
MSRTESGTTQDVFDVPAFINSRHVGAVQYGIIILCGLMMFLDGFDTQVCVPKNFKLEISVIQRLS